MVPVQFCDFDAERGLVKAWAYMGGLRPLDDILEVENVPGVIRQHRKTFHCLAFEEIRHIGVDFHGGTVNLYFRVKGPISEPMAKTFVELAGFPASQLSISPTCPRSSLQMPSRSPLPSKLPLERLNGLLSTPWDFRQFSFRISEIDL